MVPDQAVRIDVDDERRPVGVTRGQDVGRGCRARFAARNVGDEVLVVLLEHRQDSLL